MFYVLCSITYLWFFIASLFCAWNITTVIRVLTVSSHTPPSFPPSFIIYMLGLMLLLVCVVNKISKTVISHVSYLKVNSRLSAAPTLFSAVPSYMEGHPRKVEGTSKIFGRRFRAGIMCPSNFKLLSAPLAVISVAGFITCRLPWQPAGIKFTQWISDQKSAFSPPATKTMRWIEKWLPPFRIVTTFSIIMQSLEEIELRAPAVGAKIGVFLYVTLGLPARGVHSSNKYRVTMGRFWCSFQRFFQNGLFWQTINK